MPVLGPNAMASSTISIGALLWPDLHGGVPRAARRRDRRAILEYRACNLTMGGARCRRLCPLPRQPGGVGLAAAMTRSRGRRACERDRLCISRHLRRRGLCAKRCTSRGQNGKPVVALRAGRSDGSREIAQSHTASLAGASAVAAAFLKRIGVAEVDTIPELLETAKLLHVLGPPGGEASSRFPVPAARPASSLITPSERA